MTNTGTEQRTVTVTRGRKRNDCPTFKLSFSALPGQSFGPWDFAETVRDLRVSAMLAPREARDLVLNAADLGAATASTR